MAWVDQSNHSQSNKESNEDEAGGNLGILANLGAGGGGSFHAIGQLNHLPAVKLMLIGDCEVGKTLFALRYLNMPPPCDTYLPTVFDNWTAKDPVELDGTKYRVDFWDTTGHEEYDLLRPLSYPGTDCFLVCFALTAPNSMASLRKRWIPEITLLCPNTPFVLIGLQLEKRDAWLSLNYVTYEQGFQLGRELGAVQFIECSYETGKGVKEAVETAIRCCSKNLIDSTASVLETKRPPQHRPPHSILKKFKSLFSSMSSRGVDQSARSPPSPSYSIRSDEKRSYIVHTRKKEPSRDIHYLNGDVYIGNYEYCIKNGPGEYRYSNGDCYIGQFVDDKRQGKGTFKWAGGDVYEGEFKNDTISGSGEYRFNDGSVYIGPFQSQKRHGRGMMRWANGDVYEGDFVEDLKEGYGEYRFAGGNVFIGEFKSDKRTTGVYRWSNGDAYEGEFVNNVPEGKGLLISKTFGYTFEGLFSGGKRCSGQIWWPNGDSWIGEFYEDYTSKGELTFSSGEILVGMWTDLSMNLDKAITEPKRAATGIQSSLSFPLQAMPVEEVDLEPRCLSLSALLEETAKHRSTSTIFQDRPLVSPSFLASSTTENKVVEEEIRQQSTVEESSLEIDDNKQTCDHIDQVKEEKKRRHKEKKETREKKREKKRKSKHNKKGEKKERKSRRKREKEKVANTALQTTESAGNLPQPIIQNELQSEDIDAESFEKKEAFNGANQHPAETILEESCKTKLRIDASEKQNEVQEEKQMVTRSVSEKAEHVDEEKISFEVDPVLAKEEARLIRSLAKKDPMLSRSNLRSPTSPQSPSRTPQNSPSFNRKVSITTPPMACSSPAPQAFFSTQFTPPEIPIFSYTELSKPADRRPPGVIHEALEFHLSAEEFFRIFGMNRDDFAQLPIWKKVVLKKQFKLY